MIPFLRIYELSIINYLKYEVIPVHFLEESPSETLVLDSTLGGYVPQTLLLPSPTSRGRGWAFFDEATVNGQIIIDVSAEQTSRVAVTGATTFTIDYVNGVIKNPDTAPTSITYFWNYISFVEGWPGEFPPPLPVVAVDINVSERQGYQLGTGSRDVIHGSVYIFATSEQEKRDIASVINDGLHNRTLAIKNWHEGSYLDYDGTFNTDFSPTTVSGVGLGVFKNVVSNLTGPRADWSEVNRHRSRVDFEFEVFRD
jgi:hypothetical protein